MTSAGVLFLVFDVVLTTTIALVAVALVFFAALWVALPLGAGARLPGGPPPEERRAGRPSPR